MQRSLTPQLAFIGPSMLSISFDDDAQTLMTNVDQLRHFHFRTIFVNAEDGEFNDNHDLSWPTMDDDSKLLPMQTGGFVVVAGQHLYRYSPDFQLVRDVPAPDASSAASEFGYKPPTKFVWQIEHWYAQEDPSEEFIILCHATDNVVTYFWINGDTLNVLRSQSPDPHNWSYGFSASKDALVLHSESKMFISHLGGIWEPFCPSYENAVATFVAKDRVFVDASGTEGNRLVLVTDHCAQLMQLPAATAGSQVAARSQSGSRIAINESHMENTLHGVIFTVGLHVWDVVQAEEILSFSLRPKPQSGQIVRGPAFAAALSPDGKLLAILLGSKLMLYSV